MNEEYSNIEDFYKDLIVKILSDKASVEETQLLKNWIDENSDHRVYFNQIKNVWHVSSSIQPLKRFNVDKAWQQAKAIIAETKDTKTTHRFDISNIARIAAILMISFMLGGMATYLGFRKTINTGSLVQNSKNVVFAPKGSKSKIVLPDGTIVWLNSGAKLEYPSDFTAQNRMVNMKGECFFDIHKDPEHPFIVNATELKIKVYGTKFNVSENTAKKRTDVSLISGKVEVFNYNDKLLTKLNPKQQLVYDNGNSFVQNIENQEALTAWVNDMLVVENQSLDEVIEYLEKWYGVKINLDRSSYYYSYNYTFKVKNENLKEVLDLISVITPIAYHIDGNNVNIKFKPRINK